MRYRDAFPSPYFKADDLDGKEPVLTIKKVTTETMNDGDERRCAHFEETDKVLILNKTNWLACAEIIGEEDDARWTGSKIKLAKKRVSFKGDKVDAVRVETAAPPF